MWAVEFGDWLALLRRHWVSLVAATVLGALLGLAGTLAQARTYTSTAELLLTPSAEASDGQDLAYSGQYVLVRMKTYRRLAISALVRDAATGELPRGDAAIGAVDASWEPETTVLTIQVTSSSARDARTDLGLVVTQFRHALSEIERGSQRAAAVSADVIAPPTLPTSDATPRGAGNALGGAVLGFLLALGVALLRHLRRSHREA